MTSTTMAGRPEGTPRERPAQGTRVLVVDDSVVARRLVSRALEHIPGAEVVGTASNGRFALSRTEQLKPDLITMDVEMPVMDGIAAVRALRDAGHTMPIIMCSTLTARGAEATLEALAAGANDYVTKPVSTSGGLDAALAQLAGDLRLKVGVLAPKPTREGSRRRALAAKGIPPLPVWRPNGPVRVIVAGSSTGGPNALSTVLAGLSGPPPVPVLVVQHMPPVFTKQLADRLDRLSGLTVVEAQDGQVATPGTVYIAPGGEHLRVYSRNGRLVLRTDDTPPVHYSRPSVDVLFASAAAELGGGVLGVVLTGMGADGAEGAGQIRLAGGAVVAQDEASSVVWGMPGAAVRAGNAHAVVPLDGIAAAVERGLDGELP